MTDAVQPTSERSGASAHATASDHAGARGTLGRIAGANTSVVPSSAAAIYPRGSAVAN